MKRLVLVAVALFATMITRAADVERYQILKGRHYYQISAGGPLIQTNNAYRFNANVYATTNGNVKGGSIIPPNGAGQNLLSDADGDPYRVREKFDEPYLLERFYPNGGYVLNIQTLHDGNRTLTHSISGDTYPNAPYLVNYEALQNLPYNYYSEILWAPFPGGTTNDFIQVQIEKANGDTVFETPDFGKPGALNGLATRALLEPGDLDSGVTYVGTITFARVLQNGNAAYPGVPGEVGYFSRTEFPVRCVVTSIIPAIDRLEIFETERFLQTAFSPAAPESEPWHFRARVDMTSPGILTNVNVLAPSNTNYALAFDGIDRFETPATNELWATELQVRNAYGPGDYKFTTRRANGVEEQWTVPLPAGQVPPRPALSGLPPGFHEATNDLTITWAPWTATGELDFIRVEISDAFGNDVFQSPGFTSNKRLRGDATGITIPAAAFLPGRDYELNVTFRKVLSMQTRNIPGALTLSGYASRTRFEFKTVPRDIVDYGVTLGRTAWQRGADLYMHDDLPIFFEAKINPSGPGRVTNATVITPSNVILPLTLETNRTSLSFRENQGWDSALPNFPAGNYFFKYTGTNDGAKTSTVTLASNVFPPLPKLRDFSALETALGGQSASFSISWEPWTDARVGTDFVRLIIEDLRGFPVVDTGAAGSVGAQGGNTTSFGIVGDLAFQRSYVGRLRFETFEEFADPFYPGPRGYALVYSETRFYISTLGSGKFSIAIAPVAADATNLFFQLVPGLTNRLYRVERKTDSTGWAPWETNSLVNINGRFRLSTSRPAENSYFRISLLP